MKQAVFSVSNDVEIVVKIGSITVGFFREARDGSGETTNNITIVMM